MYHVGNQPALTLTGTSSATNTLTAEMIDKYQTVILSTGGGNATVFLPAAPRPGQKISVTRISAANTARVTAGSGTYVLAPLTSNADLTGAVNACLELTYNLATLTWVQSDRHNAA